MGMLVAPHEIYFGTFFERFNTRFGPPQPNGQTLWQSGGIAEIAALQKQFEIFKPGRPFLESAALLGLTGLTSGPAKDRWLEYLGRMPKMKSDDPKLSGDQRVVTALIKNLATASPMPCFMRAHDGREKEPGFVIVDEDTPLFYLESVTFLTISLPMRPDTPTATTRAPRTTPSQSPRPRTRTAPRRAGI